MNLSQDTFDTDQSQGLQVAQLLFNTLSSENVRYCHFKSNEHLEAGLRGETDLDVLVDPDHYECMKSILMRLGYKKVQAPSWIAHSAMEDWLGFDYETGSLVHVHLHTALVVGAKYSKFYFLPKDAILHDTREQSGVRVATYVQELELLTIRILLRTSFLRFIGFSITGRKPIAKSSQRELSWLMERIESTSELKANALIPPTVQQQFLFNYKSATLTLRKFFKLRRVVKAHLRSYWKGTVGECMRREVIGFLSHRIFGQVLRVRRKKRFGNSIDFVAIIGADGAGKSRLSDDLQRWLGWKLDVQHVYFGIPKKSIIPRSLGLIVRILSRLRRSKSADNWIFRLVNFLINLTLSLKWVLIGRHRLSVYRRLQKLVGAGTFVLAERFPLSAFRTMSAPMDGPRLQEDSKSKILNSLARVESNIYKQIPEPNHILVLNAGISVLRERKIDLPYEIHAEKARAVNGLAISAHPGIIAVDASQPYEEVLLDVKRRIWSVS